MMFIIKVMYNSPTIPNIYIYIYMYIYCVLGRAGFLVSTVLSLLVIAFIPILSIIILLQQFFFNKMIVILLVIAFITVLIIIIFL